MERTHSCVRAADILAGFFWSKRENESTTIQFRNLVGSWGHNGER